MDVATVCIKTLADGQHTQRYRTLPLYVSKFLTNYFENLIADQHHTFNVCQKHDDITGQGCNTPETQGFYFYSDQH